MILQFLSLFFPIFHFIALVSSVNDEGLALLSFKQSIKNSSTSYLDNWNSNDPNPCSWHGVSCKQENVSALRLPNATLSGSLYLDAGKLVALRHVNLQNNFFSGGLPISLFNSTGLRTLILSANSFSGPLPHEIGNLKSLLILDLSRNSLTGPLPSSLVQCQRLKLLALNENSFTSSLPNGLGTNLGMLQELNFSFNNFTGMIPSDLGDLPSLQGVFDLSHNLFNGSIPASLGNLSELVYINLTCNNLSGPIPQNGALGTVGPTAFLGNPLLCGLPLKTPCGSTDTLYANSNHKSLPAEEVSGRRGHRYIWCRRVLIPTVVAIMTGIALAFLCFAYRSKKLKLSARKGNKSTEGNHVEQKATIRKDMFCFRTDDLESLSENMEQYTFVALDSKVNFDLERLLKASAFLLGRSGVGIVYKAVLEKGPAVAVRRLDDGGFQRFKEFQTAMEAIGKLRHPNILTLLAYCWSVNEKLLIYDYAPNGNLATATHGRTGVAYFKPLSWSARLKIMRGIARGLAFLHEFSPKRYVHGNLKPSNVLLGETMEPCISDFGLGCFAYTTNEESAAVQSEQIRSGTPPQCSPYAVTPRNSSATRSYYEAPEASKLIKPSQKWDVYSFGMIVLEMISGKSPRVSSSEINLIRWIQLSTEVKPLSEIVDPFLAHDLKRKEEMSAVLKVALTCVHASPDKRPSMRNVTDTLERLAMIG